MTQWSSTKARKVLAALKKLGWKVVRQSGSHKILVKSGWNQVVFAFRDSDEIGEIMLKKISKNTGLKPEDL